MPRWFVVALTLVLYGSAPLWSPAVAQEVSNPHEPTFQQRRFSGWNGIAFYCSLSPDDQPNRQLCEWATQRLRVTAGSAGIDVLTVPARSEDRYLAMAKAKRRDALPVEMKVLSSEGSGAFGIHVRLAATSYYVQATESDFSAVQPERSGRPAEVIFWSRDLIGASGGRNADLDTAVRQNVETLLLKLTADFVEGNRAPPIPPR